MPRAVSADAASETLGIVTVLPRTTCESSDKPFAAASERVVKLFAAAIDHRLSPGWTTWGTPAEAGAAAPSATTRAAKWGQVRIFMSIPLPRPNQGDPR